MFHIYVISLSACSGTLRESDTFLMTIEKIAILL